VKPFFGKSSLFKQNRLLKILFLTVPLLLVSCNDDLQNYNSSSIFNSSVSSNSSVDDGYQAWLNSTQARDLNGDGQINLTDYQLWNEYLAWRDSDLAEDLNADRKIDTSDYLIFKAYTVWKNSNDAKDMNADRKIDLADFLIWQNYLAWKLTDKAVDLNNDQKIDDLDYLIFLQGSEFQGQYDIGNYEYSGPEVVLTNSRVSLKTMGPYFNEIKINVDKEGKITSVIPTNFQTTLGQDLPVIQSFFNNMKIQRISRLIVTIDTVINVNGTNVNVTFYLSEITNGYTTNLTLNSTSNPITIKFDIYHAT